MTPRIIVSAAAALVLVTGGVWGATRGEGASSNSPETVKVNRGEIAVTVGGIGHVTTLTDAARLAVPSADAAATSTSAGSSSGLAGAVFATVTGHVTSLLVGVGDEVTAGQRIARLADDGTAKAALIQAGHDLAAARLDLAQKRVQDPARGLPPTAAELAYADQSVVAAEDNLARVTGDPLPADLTAARLEVDRAVAELEAERATGSTRPSALGAAELAVETATQRLALVLGAPDPAELAAAQLEVAKAQLEQETLLRIQPAANAADIAAADAAVAAAQERLMAAQASGVPVPADTAAAEADLAKARADRDALTRASDPPTATAQAAAKLAVDAAQRRLDQLLAPPAVTVSAAQGELSRAKADLAAVRDSGGPARLTAARSAVAAAKSRLDLLRHPAPETVSPARADVARADADLAVLRQRGAPASKTDLAIAGLRVAVAEQQVLLARQLADRLTVRAPAAGTVTSVLTAGGAAVDAASPLVRVQDLANLVVSLNLTEFDVSRTRVGAVARISADALGGRPYSGRVLDVALSGGDIGGVVTFPVIATLKDAEDLRPGMSVSVRIVVASVQDAVRLPLDAIEDREGRVATIMVRTTSGNLTEREVELGLVGAAYAEVRSGLRAGERVAIPADDQA